VLGDTLYGLERIEVTKNGRNIDKNCKNSSMSEDG